MPLELGVWRIDGDLKPVDFGPLDIEARLEQILDENVDIASPNWLVIGRQVRTDHGLFIDLLAVDRDANLVALSSSVTRRVGTSSRSCSTMDPGFASSRTTESLRSSTTIRSAGTEA